MAKLITAIAHFLTAAKRTAIEDREFPLYGPYPLSPHPGIGFPYGSGDYGDGFYGYGEANP